jgi:hypothetical protein
MAFYYPQLQIQPQSGLSFAWNEPVDPTTGTSSATLGPDGVTVGMKMTIFWSDLETALKELLGYSWRDASNVPPLINPVLRRKLPWQHPYWNHLYVKRIAEVKGLRPEGKSTLNPEDTFSPSGGSVGPGYAANVGPWTEYRLAELTIQFWRPPYYVRSDGDIQDANGHQQEWLRYVSKNWEMSLNMLSRENSTFQWLPGQRPPNASNFFTGSVGQTVSHFRVTRTWYQIPEQALFNTLVDATPNGLPANMIYTQTPTENPISRFDQACGTAVTTITVNSTVTTTVMPSTTIPSTVALLTAAGYTYPAGSPMGGCVNAPVGGLAIDGLGNWVDATIASRFFGCYSGTLRFDGVTFTPQPLQLPAYLMGPNGIPLFSNSNEPISQLQYDVTFHFDLFDPPPGVNYKDPVTLTSLPLKGHNLFPYSGNGLWYPILSQQDQNASTVGVKLTPFQYCDMTDLFRLL